MIDRQSFLDSLEWKEPDPGYSDYLKSLWYDRKGDWNSAHDLIQHLPTTEAAWIHAYLHRKEGDIGNAGYWYESANKPICDQSLGAEWTELVDYFLKNEN